MADEETPQADEAVDSRPESSDSQQEESVAVVPEDHQQQPPTTASKQNLFEKQPSQPTLTSKQASKANFGNEPRQQEEEQSTTLASKPSSKQNLMEDSTAIPASKQGSKTNLNEQTDQTPPPVKRPSLADLISSSKQGSKANLSDPEQTQITTQGSKANLTTSQRPSQTLPGQRQSIVNATPLPEQPPQEEQGTVSPAVAVAAGPGFEIPPKDDYKFLNKSSVYTKPEAWLPEEAEMALAKSFLKANQEGKYGKQGNLYDHLTTVVMRVLEQRPMLSADVKRNKFQVEQRQSPSSFKRVPSQPKDFALAKNQIKLMVRHEADETDVEAGGEVPDILELSKLWEWAGISFGQEETFLLFLSLKKLVVDKQLKSVRLWGKLLGLNQNYIVVEAELKDGVVDEEDVIANGQPEEETELDGSKDVAIVETGFKDGEEVSGTEKAVPVPKPKTKPTASYSKEVRTGVNKYIYYVCNYAGGQFTRLPDVLPEKLQVNSYPAFNGTEAQLVRCQIARITSATVLSPNGYYTFDPEEESGEDEHSSTIIINNEYEGLSNENLLNTSNWVHHSPYILPQGRATWENPYKSSKSNEDGEEDDEEEGNDSENGDLGDSGNGENSGPESGPPILTPINVDEDVGDIPSWTSRSGSHFSPSKFSPVVLRSTRWPGAAVVAYNDKFASVYIGDGQKSLGNPMQYFIVPKLPEVQNEYGFGAEVKPVAELVEQGDPTIEEEKAFEDSQKVKTDDGGDEEKEEGDDADEVENEDAADEED